MLVSRKCILLSKLYASGHAWASLFSGDPWSGVFESKQIKAIPLFHCIPTINHTMHLKTDQLYIQSIFQLLQIYYQYFNVARGSKRCQWISSNLRKPSANLYCNVLCTKEQYQMTAHSVKRNQPFHKKTCFSVFVSVLIFKV